MKALLTIILSLTLFSCGNNADRIALQKRFDDSIASAKMDSLNTAKKVIKLREEYIASDSIKNELQKRYDSILYRLNSLTAFNNKLAKKLKDQNSDIAMLKSKIAAILIKNHLSDAEKRKAVALIYELEYKVHDLK